MTHSLDLRERWTGQLRTNEIQDRVDFLLGLGFSSSVVNVIKSHTPTLHHKEIVQEKIEALRLLGFTDPIKLITLMPAILGYDMNENLHPKIQAIHSLGFADPIKLISFSPSILGLNIKENVQPKIEALRLLGFTDPIKLITLMPAILSFSIELNIQPKIEALRLLGFTDPIKLITLMPAILCYSIDDNIKPKINALRALGFVDPVKLIASYPWVLCLNIDDNIKPKIKILDTFIKDKEISRWLVLRAPEILGTKIDKTWTILRGLYELNLLTVDTISQYKQINIRELEAFILAIRELQDNRDFVMLTNDKKLKKLFSTCERIKKSWTKKDRAESVLQVSDKIGERYSRGYYINTPKNKARE